MALPTGIGAYEPPPLQVSQQRRPTDDEAINIAVGQPGGIVQQGELIKIIPPPGADGRRGHTAAHLKLGNFALKIEQSHRKNPL